MANHYQPRGGGRSQYDRSKEKDWAGLFETDWLAEGITKKTVKYCEDFGKFLKETGLSTSQIRNVYGELKRIQLKGYDKEKTAFLLLKPKMAYAAKRANKPGVYKLKDVFEKAYDQIDEEGKYQNFMFIMEAILAYHKSFGGK